jgi:hypothetical protein
VTDLAIALDATVGPDEADPATRALRGLALPRFVDALDPNALAGARIGALAEWLLDSAAERPVTAVVREALAAMAAAGAEVIDVTIPGMDSLLARTGVIGFEFQTDLAGYLAATPGAAVAGLPEIVELGLHHEQLDATYRQRTWAEARDEAEYQSYLTRQTALRDALVAFMDANDLDAIAYPTLREEPELIGAAPLGTSIRSFLISGCPLAAQSGLPAISTPAGFTDRVLPVGVELMGRPFADARLVSLAYALEQATSPRRPPYRTPPLVSGAAPAPSRVSVSATGTSEPTAPVPETLDADLVLDVPSGTLGYSTVVSGVADADVFAVVLRRVVGEAPHSVVHRLSRPGQSSATGTVELTSIMLADLLEGRLELALYTARHPLGSVAIRLANLAGG